MDRNEGDQRYAEHRRADLERQLYADLLWCGRFHRAIRKRHSVAGAYGGARRIADQRFLWKRIATDVEFDERDELYGVRRLVG